MPTERLLQRSVGGSTVFHWPSSWLLPEFVQWRPSICSHGWTIGSVSFAVARAARSIATRRSTPRWTGRINC